MSLKQGLGKKKISGPLLDRMIADLAGSEYIQTVYVAEAVQFPMEATHYRFRRVV